MEKYQRVKKIGEGAFGKAILVKQKQNGRQCVIKEISLGRMGPKEREDSRKEVSVLSQLNHPNIVTYLESFEERGTLYICMDYCAGGDLYTKINQQRGALMSEEQIWNYFAQICLAIKHIHDRKILHRDIKSQNIFLTAESRVKIGDFGIAKVLNNTMELARTCIGTPYYLSPELVENKPYNNKSDVWSLGCVLYEMTTLKHAFEAGNMKNLVLKIIRGVYPPIPPKYSYDLRGVIAQLFKRSPRDRPSINSLLRKNIMMQKVRSVLSDEKFAEEFSHTIMHGKKISRALPPPPRPSSACSRPSSAASNRPGSAAKKPVNKPKYDPASVYGAPLVKKSRERPDLKKKNNSGGRIIPGQADWDKKRLELKEKEKQRREVEKQKEQDLYAKQYKELKNKQKAAQINRSRELGWKNVLEPGLVRQDDPQPVLQKPQMIVPKQQEIRVPVVEGRGRYDQYNAYLDKLQQDRINRIRDGGPVPMPRPAAVPYMQVGQDPMAAPRFGREQFQFNRGPQIDANRRESNERAKIAQEFLNRKQQAAVNKARAQAQLGIGNRPPSGLRAVTPKTPGPSPGAAAQVRNREEQDYLAQLRKIREQNMKERKALQARKDAGTPDLNKYKPPQDEERKKKLEALKKQADDWAMKYEDENNRNLVALRRGLEDQAKSRPPSRGAQSRPSSAKKPAAPAVNMKPAPAVPITGILQAIGAADEPPAVQPVSPSPGLDDKTRQVQKENILKRLNERNRPKWGPQGGAFVPASTAAPEEEPGSARSQWGEGQTDLGLGDMTLEETSSKMEATSAGDEVIRSPDGKIIGVARGAAGSGDPGKGDDSNRQGWGRPGATVVKVLQGLPIIEGTMSSTVSGESEGSQSPAPRVDIVSGIGATVTLSKPSMIREGTITIKSAEDSANNKDALPVAPSLADRNLEEVKAALAAIEDLEDDSNIQSEEENYLVKSNQSDSDCKPVNQSDSDCKPVNQSDSDCKPVNQSDSDCKPVNQSDSDCKPVNQSDSDCKPVNQSDSDCKPVNQSDSDCKPVNQSDSDCKPVNQSDSDCKPVNQSDSDCKPVNQSNTDIQNIKSVNDQSELKEDNSNKTEVKSPRQSVADKIFSEVKEDVSYIPEPKLVFKKPVLLPKPDLSSAEFAKPVIAPEIINDKGEGHLFSRVDLHDDDEDDKIDKPNWEDAKSVKDEGKMVSKGLCTGNFDINNVGMLRTCSEPDLSKLFQTSDNIFLPTLTHHASLDRLKTVQEEVDEDLEMVRQSLEMALSPRSDNSEPKSEGEVKDRNGDQEGQNGNDDNNEDNEFDEEDIDIDDDDDDDDEDGDDDEDEDDDDDDDDDDMISVRETMQSLLIDEDEEVIEKKGDSKKREDVSDQDLGQDNTVKGSNSKTSEDDSSSKVELDNKLNHSQSDSVLADKPPSLRTDTLSELFQGDSDDETTFGDDDNDDVDDDDDDYDVYGRLEQTRAELEEALGFDLFIEVYNKVQEVQEDEDEKIDEGAKIALDLLGEKNHHLYPKIFQLVMADTAFTEDNS